MASQLVGALTDVKEKVIATALSGKALLVAGALGFVGEQAVMDYVSGRVPKGLDLPGELVRKLLEDVGTAEELIGEPIFDALIGATVNRADFSKNSGAYEAAQLVKRFLGFGAGLPLAAAQIEAGLEVALGPHAPKAVLEAIRDLPGELGVNFFIGTVIERIFEEAVSQPLGEAIREAYHPIRLEVQQIIRLLKTKDIDPEKANDLLNKAGVRPEDIPLFAAFDRTNLPMGDIQTAYLAGVISEDQAVDYLRALGIAEQDIPVVRAIYLDKAMTEGGNVYRSVARAAFVDNLITEGQFRDILALVNVPAASADLEVQALTLQKSIGKSHLSLATIRQLLAQGDISQDEARSKIVAQGLSVGEANELLTLWGQQTAAGKVGVSEGRVLSYLASGVLTQQEAYARLLKLGIRPEDAQLLTTHPRATAGKVVHELTAGTILTAYKDGTLDDAQARAKLAALGQSPEEVQLEMEHAALQATRASKPKGGAKSLTAAEILAALEHDLATSAWTLHELVTFGYSEGDAQLLVAEALVRATKAAPPGWVVLT